MKKLLLSFMVFFASCGGSGGDFAGDPSSFSEEDSAELADLINDYRVENGLSRVTLSTSLDSVAQAHVGDLEANPPDGETCLLHSWSDDGDWSDCCYTGANEASCMYDKPDEITGGVYTSEGYEIAILQTSGLDPESALEGWKESDPHNDVILNLDPWNALEWRALGVGISEHYAVAWFGAGEDPAGEP